MIATCELCERPAVWRLIAPDGQTAVLCDNHRHAAGDGSELTPLRPCDASGPEPLGSIMARLVDPAGLIRPRRFITRFRPDR